MRARPMLPHELPGYAQSERFCASAFRAEPSQATTAAPHTRMNKQPAPHQRRARSPRPLRYVAPCDNTDVEKSVTHNNLRVRARLVSRSEPVVHLIVEGVEDVGTVERDRHHALQTGYLDLGHVAAQSIRLDFESGRRGA